MVEIDPCTEKVLRIFRADKYAYALEPERIRQLPRAEAVKRIREQVCARANGRCEYGCGRAINWDSGEMHEELPKGKGGEVSLANSYFICPTCHREDERGHRSRRLRFGETTNDNLN